MLYQYCNNARDRCGEAARETQQVVHHLGSSQQQQNVCMKVVAMGAAQQAAHSPGWPASLPWLSEGQHAGS